MNELKNIIESIPKSREGLFNYKVNWTLLATVSVLVDNIKLLRVT